jgi:hypothetical protein
LSTPIGVGQSFRSVEFEAPSCLPLKDKRGAPPFSPEGDSTQPRATTTTFHTNCHSQKAPSRYLTNAACRTPSHLPPWRLVPLRASSSTTTRWLAPSSHDIRLTPTIEAATSSRREAHQRSHHRHMVATMLHCRRRTPSDALPPKGPLDL